jgi:hypothetical protein
MVAVMSPVATTSSTRCTKRAKCSIDETAGVPSYCGSVRSAHTRAARATLRALTHMLIQSLSSA